MSLHALSVLDNQWKLKSIITMNRKIYKQPHMYVRVINPEELLQVVIDSKQPSVPPEEADSKFNHFDDADDYGFSSDDIWED